MPIKHTHQSASADSTDAGVIQPSHWNADHNLEGMLALLDVAAPTPNVVFTLNGSAQLQLLPYSSFAPSFSPAFTGVPTAPTPAAGVNTTQIATMEALQTAIANLVASAPGTLDTLNEIATALGDDPNFSATITASLGNRLRIDAAQGLTSGQQAQGRSNLGLGTVATLNVGTGANNIVQLDGSSKLPAVDGSQLTGINFTGALRYDIVQGLTAPQTSQARQNIGMTDGQLPATATNDSALAGKVGECITNSASVSTMTSGTVFNFCSIVLTPGDWDVSAKVLLTGAPWTVQTCQCGVNTVSATLPGAIGLLDAFVGPFEQYYNLGLTVPPYRFSVSANTTLYLVGNVTWNAGSGSMAGRIQARRMR
ncbi:hypothetical protein [Bradyrhizobium vignae]|uniref:hypothetical protein n=1 Tax=Bradyrhizobium vignae TaxID=1549949 RepID=UPI00100B408B|nr:hypothetical protein [Bradyrhizobium vignae]RXG87647.1 hypothetical protein EAV90_31815 [Bradyrhizobium vignae]